MEALSEILEKIKNASQAAGREQPPALLAVSKFQSIEKILDLYSKGQRHFGENYVQELLAKRSELISRGVKDVEFHFIGKLQSNKVRQLLPAVAAIHSIDSIKLLREVDRRALELGLHPQIYFQINIDEEESKSGFRVGDIPEILTAVQELKAAIPSGLMAIPDPNQNPREAFHRMKLLSDQYGKHLGTGLSIGMSGDFVSAIESGSTVIRIGTALFGERLASGSARS